MSGLTRRQCVQATAGWVAGAACQVLAAEPSARPAVVRIVLPLPAGGPVDVLVRRLAESLASVLQAPVIVDNRPGAAGVVGARLAALSPPDGGTLFYLHSGLLTQQAMSGRLDLLAMFQPLIRLHASPYAPVVRASLPVRTQAQLITAIQARPGQLTFGSGGNGSPSHLLLARLDAQVPAGLVVTHVPYKGGTDAVLGMLAGDIDFGFVLPGAVAEAVSAGRLRVLSVTGAQRLPPYPEWPTVEEAGIRGFQAEPWGGLAVPLSTPSAIVQRLAEAVRQAALTPSVAAALQDQGGGLP